MSTDKKEKKTTQGLSKPLIVRTVIILTVCGVAAFIVLAVRLFDVQITNTGRYEALALDNQLQQATITASRGTIFDTNGKILAMSASVENVFISPYEIVRDEQDIELIADRLSAILGVTRDSILEHAKKTTSMYQIVKHKVERDEASQVREFISEYEVRGVYLEPTSKRYYPNNSHASQILGFVGTGENGLDGLEQRYDTYLTGVNGRLVRLKNARGTILMFPEYEDHFDAHDGNNITLTIDSGIQYYIEKHLEQAIEDYDVQNGAMCIAMNAKTGAILAIANHPNFDPNDFLQLSKREMEKLGAIEDEVEYNEALRAAQYRQWRNRALADTYEPGSVFKILTFAIALEENVASLDSVFDCRGSKEVLGRDEEKPVRCWRRWGHGPQDLNHAMQNSCNIASVELGLRIGARTFYKYVDAFGLRSKTGLDNSAEGTSLWWPDRVFFDRENHSQLASASFGQTFNVTPIQMITAVAAVVNGGYLMQPYIVKQVTNSEGNIIHASEPTVLRQVISAGTSATTRALLEDVVKTGTGKNAQVSGYRVGGKTGTSEYTVQVAASGEDALKDYIVSFIGFAPADDPEIIILLLLDTPSHETGIYISGGAMAAPVVGSMFADILPLCLEIKPQYTESELKDINIEAPRIINRSVEDAITILSSQGFEYVVVGGGDSVIDQLPAPNMRVASGTTMMLFTEESAPHDSVIVPNLSGMSYSSAKQALESRGIFIRTSGAPKSDSNVRVSVQSIHAGQETLYGSVVEVTLIDKDVIELRN